MIETVLTAAQALIAAIVEDENRSGGLLSRATIRKADELRIAISNYKRGK